MDRKHCPGGKCDYAEDRVQEDRQGRYVEDEAANYHKSRQEIFRALDDGRGFRDGQKRSWNDFDSDRKADQYDSRSRGRSSRYEGDYEDSSSSHYPHLTEEEWILKQKKEQKNLDELTKKEKELETASKEVNSA